MISIFKLKSFPLLSMYKLSRISVQFDRLSMHTVTHLHGVQLHEVIIQICVSFSLKDIRDAHDHRSALNIITTFHATKLIFWHHVLLCDTQAEEMDDGRWPCNQAVDILKENQLGYAPQDCSGGSPTPCRHSN